MMKYRYLGNTGLRVSEISFGTIPILSGDVPVLPDYYSPDDETAVNIMNYAFSLGCNLFDTAIMPEYSDAEIKLGKFPAMIGREKIIISDKSRFFDGNDMYNAVLESIENLQTVPDIYFVHQVDEDNADEVFGNYGALDALTDLKKDGKIRFTGIATHYYSILYRAAKDNRVDVLQGSGNIVERGMLDRLASENLFKNKGFILNKIYAAGILPNYFSVKTLLKGALSYPISSALIGLGTTRHIDLAMGHSLDPYHRPTFSEVMSVLEQSFSPIPCHRCQRCRCIYGTEIHILFRQYNYFYMGKDYWALRKLDMGIDESALKCKKCIDMSCMKQCPQKIQIPETVQKIQQLVEIHVRNSWI